VIEPTQDGKCGCVGIFASVVDEFVATEHLNDVVSALCRAVETETVQLQEAAFPALHCVFAVFRNKMNDDGMRLFDLHDSQFAAKAAFLFAWKDAENIRLCL
jgi:hypothetical protein